MTPLAEELRDDPLGRGYAQMGVNEIVASLTTEDREYVAPLSSATLLAWSGAGTTGEFSTSRFERIESAGSGHASGVVRGACKAAFLLIGRDGTTLDLSLPDRQQMLGALVAGGVLSAAEQAELVAMATRLRSRAAELGLVEVRHGDIMRAQQEIADA